MQLFCPEKLVTRENFFSTGFRVGQFSGLSVWWHVIMTPWLSMMLVKIRYRYLSKSAFDDQMLIISQWDNLIGSSSFRFCFRVEEEKLIEISEENWTYFPKNKFLIVILGRNSTVWTPHFWENLEMASRSALRKRTFVSKIDGKEYVRPLAYDECFELVHNQGRLLSEEYKGKLLEF